MQHAPGGKEAIGRLHAVHPDVRVLLNTSTQMLNLARREADIAVRTMKPENPDLVARLVRIWPERARAQPYEVWLVTHQDLRHTARVRAVIGAIVDGFERER